MSKFSFKFVDWRPTSDKETLLHAFENQPDLKNVKYRVFIDNPP